MIFSLSTVRILRMAVQCPKRLASNAGRVAARFRSVISVYSRWEDLEYFDEGWKARIQEMARFIAPGESIVDLGCGRMWLKAFIYANNYYPVDYKPRGETTSVADFNRGEFPSIWTDVAFVSGTLEYVKDYSWFIRQISLHARRCIVSYCTTECYPDFRERRRRAWKNHLSRLALIETFRECGMGLDAESTIVPRNPIFVFSKPTGENVIDSPLVARVLHWRWADRR